jgi:Na+/melibiose symporter-like transporter
MTPAPPLRAGDASRLDHEALAQLEVNDAERLTMVRGRAQKWIGGLTALTGLLGTVLVLKGPGQAAGIPMGWRIIVAVLVALSMVLLAWATFNAYRGAYGDPGKLDEVDRNPVKGLHERLASARLEVAEKAQQRLRAAVVLTFLGIGAIVAATALTWFVPPAGMGDSPGGHTCITAGGETIATVAAETLPVVSLASGVALVPCE